MQSTKFELRLKNGDTVLCSKIGHGPRIAQIAGPASFYLSGMGPLFDEFTFITADSDWTYRKPYGKFFTEKQIEHLTAESIIERDHQITEALKKEYKTSKIYGFGLSGPGGLPIKQQEKYKDYCNLLLFGVGMTPLDPTFKTTDEYFYKHDKPARIARHQQMQADYAKLKFGLENNQPVDAELLRQFGFKADGKAAKKFQEKPHKRFLAEAISNTFKLLENPKLKLEDGAEKEDLIIKHWKHNLAGPQLAESKFAKPGKPLWKHEHVDKRMQEHFFGKIYPELNSLETLKAINTPTLVLSGDEDYITPFDEVTEHTLKQLPHVRLRKIEKAAHMVYMEQPEAFRKAVMDHVHLCEEPKLRAKL